jgi:hypothetical protein
MKRLREMIFDDSSSEEEDDEDEDLEMAMVMILNEDFRAPKIGSLFIHAWINRDKPRACQDHAGLLSLCMILRGSKSSSNCIEPSRTRMHIMFYKQILLSLSMILTVSTSSSN